MDDLKKPIENLNKKPAKSILKTPSSTENQPSLNRQSSQDKDIKWDENNILQTLHPADKDYGHMKIEEPKTPYSYYNEDNDECNSDNEMPTEIDPNALSKMIGNMKEMKSKFSFDVMGNDSGESFEEIESENDEDRKRRNLDFEEKRKKHYNEYQMVKLARQLLKDEMEENDD